MEIKEFIIKAIISLVKVIIVALLLMGIAKVTNLVVMLISAPFIGIAYGIILIVFARWKNHSQYNHTK